MIWFIIGIGIYFAYKLIVKALSDRIGPSMPVAQKEPKRSSSVMFFSHEEIWPEMKDSHPEKIEVQDAELH